MNIDGNNNNFTWGDSVVVQKNSPKKFQPGRYASICGFYKVESKEIANELECNIGDWIYTVEFEDGSDIQVPERYLERDFSVTPGRELSKYSNYFISGTVSKININIDYIEIELKSTVVSQEVFDNPMLSKDKNFNGKIIATQIKNITIRHSSHSIRREQNGTISAFEVSDHTLKLNIEWSLKKTTSIEIKSGQIWWQQEFIK